MSEFPARKISADQAQEVTFRTAEPGYFYGDVDDFTNAVVETLLWLESANNQLARELTDARAVCEELQNKVITLTHTVEVFRVRGDVIATADGEVLTSEWRDYITQLENRIRELERIGSAGEVGFVGGSFSG